MNTKTDNSIKIIAAVSSNNAIGIRGELPWHLPEDLKHFREITMGNTILMGWNTWQSLGEMPLPGRLNIVLSHNVRYLQKGVVHISNPGQLDTTKTVGDIFVIGGAQVYQLYMSVAKEMYITRVHMEVEKTQDTVYFPRFGKEWILEERSKANFSYSGLFYEFDKYVRSDI